MRKIFLSIFVIFICSLNFFAQTNVPNEEYAVYSRVLRGIYSDYLKQSKTELSFVILGKTSFNPNVFDEYTAKRFGGLLRDFRRKNSTISKLDRLFPVKYQYEITSQSEVDELLEIGAKELESVKAKNKERHLGIVGGSEVVWKPFYKKYPKSYGYYEFSRVGFSSDKRFALVTVEGKGGSWDSSMQYILKKIKGRWRIHLSGGSVDIE